MNFVFFIPNVNSINALSFLRRFNLNFLDLLKNKVFQIPLATTYQQVAMVLLRLPDK